MAYGNVNVPGGGSRAVTKTLSASGWVQNGSVYEQTITVEGMLADQNGIAGEAQNLTEGQREALRAAGLYIKNQQNGSLTIASDGETPTCDIPILIILLG